MTPTWDRLAPLQRQLIERGVALGPDAAATDPVCERLRGRVDALWAVMVADDRANQEACRRQREAWIVWEHFGVQFDAKAA